MKTKDNSFRAFKWFHATSGSGRAMLIAAIPAPLLLMIFSTLLWLNPSFSVRGKVIWVLVMYIGYGMTVTMYTMPQTAILPACIKDNDKRNEVISLGAGISAVAFTVGTSFTQDVKGFFEN